MRYPQKHAPGQYDVECYVEGTRFLWRFKTERDAMRFFWASTRGTRVKNHYELADHPAETGR